jgi:hypothetical protein
MMKNIFCFVLFIGLFFSCDMEEVYIDVYDPEQERIDSINQRKSDVEIIYSYLESNEIQTVDTTNEGVFYSVLDYGNPEIIPVNNDIISLNLSAFYTTDSIYNEVDSIDLVFFDTNIQSVAENAGIVDESKFYVPLTYTYNGNGTFFPVVSDHGYLALLSDFKKALGFSLSKIGENGKIKILMPSGNGYGENGNVNTPVIPGNSVLIFDIHLIKIRK